MIKIDIASFIKDRVWFGWYWVNFTLNKSGWYRSGILHKQWTPVAIRYTWLKPVRLYND